MNKEEQLILMPKGDEYALVRIDGNGKQTEIILSETNVMFLPELVRDQIKKILAKRLTPIMKERGVEPVIALPVVQTALNTDLHQTVIHLMILDQFGNQVCYSLPLEVAEPLANRMPSWIEKIAKKSNIKQ